jgi:hypothetical protein
VAEYPVRSPFLMAGQVALGAIAAIVAVGLLTSPSGSAVPFGIAGAIVVAAFGAILIRGLRRQAILVDGDRFGWRRGLTNKVIGWTDLDDVEVATTAQLSTSITRKHPDVILWTRVGGLRGGNAILLRRQLPGEVRERLDARSASAEPLHPFIVPFSALGDDGREAIATSLEARGLLPG